MQFFPEVSVPFDEDSYEACIALVRRFRPLWAQEAIVGKPLQGGCMNKVLVFQRESCSTLEDAIVFKIYGNVRDDMADGAGEIPEILSRDWELVGMQIGHAAGCFPSVLAVWQNGIAYEYAQGRKLRHEDVNDPVIVRAVARTAADLHSVDLKQVEVFDKHGRKTSIVKGIRFQPALRVYVAGAPEKLDNPATDQSYQILHAELDDIHQEMEFILDSVDALRVPWAYCHNDLHINNILYNETTGKVTFVDWELSRYNYAVYDSELFFVQSLYVAAFVDGASIEPLAEPSTAREWTRAYQERREEHRLRRHATQLPPGEVAQKHDELLLVEFNIFRIFHQYYWLAIGLLMVNSPVITSMGLDMTGSMHLAWASYRALRPQLEDLMSKHNVLSQQLAPYRQMCAHDLHIEEHGEVQ